MQFPDGDIHAWLASDDGLGGLGTGCGFDGQPPPCCAGYVVLRQAADAYPLGSCAPIGGRIALNGGHATVNANGTLTPCCLISGTCYPVGTHVPSGVVAQDGTTTYCIVQPDCGCYGGTAPGGVIAPAHYDAVNGCIVQPFDSTKSTTPPVCNAVDPSARALVEMYGIAELMVPIYVATDIKNPGNYGADTMDQIKNVQGTRPPVKSGVWVPAFLSMTPRPPSQEEQVLIRQRGVGSDSGATDIYRFDWKGVHYVAWYTPDNAFTQGLYKDFPWLRGTIEIQPWQEGWDNVVSVLAQTGLNFLEGPFRFVGFVLQGLKDILADLLCGASQRGLITGALAVAAAAEKVPATLATTIMSALCGGAVGCPAGYQIDPATGTCVQPTSTWLYVGIGAVVLGAAGVGYLALRPKRKAA